MTLQELEAAFERNEGEFIEFDRIAVKRSPAADVHAFLLLIERFGPPATGDVVTWAGHDEIALFPMLGDPVPLSEADVIELIRCGVRLDDGCFKMLV